MKLIIAGGRDFKDYGLLKSECDKITGITEIVSGAARGADSLGVTYAIYNHIRFKEFPPDYKTFGSRAPLKRNCDMADYADSLIAFWNGKSTGTAHMIQQAKKRNLSVIVINY